MRTLIYKYIQRIYKILELYIQMSGQHKGKNIKLVNFKLNKNIVEVLDQLVQTGLYKSRVDVLLAALRNYEPFQIEWKRIGQKQKMHARDE